MSLLEIEGVHVARGGTPVLHGVSLEVDAREAVCLLGRNGMGKTTLLRTVMGLTRTSTGRISVDGSPIHRRPTHAVARLGVAYAPQGRGIFSDLSVEENLSIAKRRGAAAQPVEALYELFPMLAERRHMSSTSLSGGQQQMVAIGRALMSNPKLLLCDEISLGLAPIVVREVYARLPSIVAEGSSLIIVEQDIVQALKAANRVYCLQEGRVALTGSAATLTRDAISAAYFGA